jgi:hypothetical protein
MKEVMRETARTQRRATKINERVVRLVRDEPDSTYRLLVLTLIENRQHLFPTIRPSLVAVEPEEITRTEEPVA